jgi:signal peptidase I
MMLLILGGTGFGMALAAAVWWARARFVIVTAHGPSMEPAYRDGDRLLVRRTRSGIRVGAVVVGQRFGGGADIGGEPARGPRRWIIKRIAAMPGDPVPAEVRTAAGASATAGGTVPPGAVVLLGENPAHSHDSRSFGFYPADRLFGVVVRKLSRPAPPDRANRSRWSLERGPRAG